MPFGLGKTEKRVEEEEKPQETPEDAGDETPEQGGNGAHGAPSSAEAVKPAASEEGEESGAYRPPSFRPSFPDEAEPKAAKAPAVPPPDGDTFFITVTKDGTTEIHSFTTPAEAQAFVEEILGEGVQEDAVAAFTGRKLDLKVSHRPVVKLFSDSSD